MAEPGPGGQRHHRSLTLHGHRAELGRPGTEEARAGVAELSGDRVDVGAEKHAVGKADVEVDRAATVVTKHEQRVGCRRERLHTHGLQTVLRTEGEDANGGVERADGEEPVPEVALRNRSDVQARHVAARLQLLNLHELTSLIELEVDELAAGQRDDHLPRVGGHPRHRLPPGRPPLVDSLIGADVPQTAGVHLQQRIIPEQRGAQGRHRAQVATVADLFHGLTDGQHQRGVGERDDDVGVKLILRALANGEHRVGVTRQGRYRHLRERHALPEHPQRGPRAGAAQGVQLRGLLGNEVVALHVEHGAQRLDVVDGVKVSQTPGLEKHGLVSLVRLHERRRARLHIVLVVADALELVKSVVAKLRRREEETRLEHAYGDAGRDGVEVLDLHLAHGLRALSILHRDFVNVAVLGLSEEKELLLGPVGC